MPGLSVRSRSGESSGDNDRWFSLELVLLSFSLSLNSPPTWPPSSLFKIYKKYVLGWRLRTNKQRTIKQKKNWVEREKRKKYIWEWSLISKAKIQFWQRFRSHPGARYAPSWTLKPSSYSRKIGSFLEMSSSGALHGKMSSLQVSSFEKQLSFSSMWSHWCKMHLTHHWKGSFI